MAFVAQESFVTLSLERQAFKRNLACRSNLSGLAAFVQRSATQRQPSIVAPAQQGRKIPRRALSQPADGEAFRGRTPSCLAGVV